MKNGMALEQAADKALQFLRRSPLLSFSYPVVRNILAAVAGRRPWEDLQQSLTTLQKTSWSLTEIPPGMKRRVTSVERPRFFNPFSLAVECLVYILTGMHELVHLPAS